MCVCAHTCACLCGVQSAGDRNSVSSQSSPRSSRLSCSSSSGGVVGGVQRGSLATTPENAYQGLQTGTVLNLVTHVYHVHTARPV